MNKILYFQNIAYKSTLFSLLLFFIISACEVKTAPAKTFQITSLFTETRIPSTLMTFVPLSPTIIKKPESTNTPVPVPTSTFPPDRWISNGPNGRAFWALAVNPVLTSIIFSGSYGYNGTAGQGVFKSLDGGRNWIPSNNGISYWNIRSIIIDPKTPSNVYISGGVDGIDRSDDDGKTWQTMDMGLMDENGLVGYASCLAINPQNPSILYAGMDKGIYKGSSDQGLWIADNLGIPKNYGIDSIVIDPNTPTTIYAGATHVNAKLTDGIILKKHKWGGRLGSNQNWLTDG